MCQLERTALTPLPRSLRQWPRGPHRPRTGTATVHDCDTKVAAHSASYVPPHVCRAPSYLPLTESSCCQSSTASVGPSFNLQVSPEPYSVCTVHASLRGWLVYGTVPGSTPADGLSLGPAL